MHEPSAPQHDDQALLDHLAGHDLPCPRCAYNLRGLSQPRCPECGEPLVLRVGRRDAKLGTWILACTALLLIVGANMLLLMVVADARGFRRFNEIGEFVLLAIGLVAIPMSISMIMRRRRFLWFKPLTQRIIAWACWLTALYYFASFYQLFFRGW